MRLKPVLLLFVLLGCAGSLYAAYVPEERPERSGTKEATRPPVELDPTFQFDRPRPTPTPTPSPTYTPFYGRCVEDLDRKLHCAIFPGFGESRCRTVDDCYTPTPTPTPTTVPEPPRQCLCSCMAGGDNPEYVCSRPFEFRLLRLRWVCPDVEAGTFPKTFAREVGTVPDHVDVDYCNRWNDTVTRGYLSSRSPGDGERCVLSDCVQAYVK